MNRHIKWFAIVIIFIIISSCCQVTALSKQSLDDSEIENTNTTTTSYLGDELDQEQTQLDGWIELSGQNVEYIEAQGFTPQKDVLTRIQLLIQRFGVTNPVSFAIRKELTGENLTTMTISGSSIPYQATWYTFDIDDIPVIPGETYHFIFSFRGEYLDGYAIGLGTGDPYRYGNNFYGTWQHWQENPFVDLCFKTYGRNIPLKITTQTGLGKVHLNIENQYGYDISNVEWTIHVTGGFLKNVDVVTTGTISTIPSGNTVKVSTDQFIFGLGPCKINYLVKVTPTEQVTRRIDAFLFLFLLLLT